MSDAPPNTLKADIRSSLIASANGTIDLIKKAEKSDPDLAASLKAKSLIGSKSVWAPLATWLVSLAATKLGLGLDADTSAEISSLLAYVVVVICRYVTRSPIGGVVSAPQATGLS